MEQRRMINKKLYFQIPFKEFYTYKQDILWEDLIKTPGILPTDILNDISWGEEKESGFASMKMEDELKTYKVAYITIIRNVLETDEEFFARVKQEEKQKNINKEKDRLEYLRWKAKFEL